MSRTVPNSILAAHLKSVVYPFYAVELIFDTSPVRLWTGLGDRVINGNTYLGGGHLFSIGGLEEASDMTAKSASLSLSGVTPELISMALLEPYQNRVCRIYYGVVDSTEVVEVFSGSMDQMSIQDSAEQALINISVESKWVRLDRANVRRYTSESQKSRYPNDTFFDYVASLQDAEILWGRTSS